jgi:hypothetical protein
VQAPANFVVVALACFAANAADIDAKPKTAANTAAANTMVATDLFNTEGPPRFRSRK